jgi:hypothetical protein
MGAINKEVFIPKLQMDYLDDPQHLYQITNENARNFIDESWLVLMSKNCCTDAIRVGVLAVYINFPIFSQNRRMADSQAPKMSSHNRVPATEMFQRFCVPNLEVIFYVFLQSGPKLRFKNYLL